MPLTLITGPANAEKAGHVLAAYRAALDDEPLLVVPTFADMDHYRRELAAAGAVFGVRVVTFSRLMREIARRAGVGGSGLGRLVRERVAAAAIAGTNLQALRASSQTPGFVQALLRLATELEERRVDPARWWVAMRAWGEREPPRAAYAEELARLYGAYRDGLEKLGRRDRVLLDQAALDALRLQPGRWRATPVFFYGFDDLTPAQRDAVETLAVHAEAPVMVSLAYEPGRVAFAGRGETFQELMALGPLHVELPARAQHYARRALHALERTLFEPQQAKRPDPGDALKLLEGGGERAEIELVAAHVARLIRDKGFAPEDIAVVLREPRDQAALIAQVFTELEVPFALDRWIGVGHTALGRGVVALLRCALSDGSADDLLAWLRTPGKLAHPALADRLEQRARVDGATTAKRARALWEADHPDFTLDELDRLAQAASDPAALCRRLAAETSALFAAPHRGSARVLVGAEALEARVAATLRQALAELERLAAAGERGLVPGPADLARVLAELEVRAHDDPRPGVVAITSPQALRARRVRALFLCGLREDAFPRPPTPEPFLGDEERRAINAASGLRLRLREDRLDAERYLLYAATSRPTELLALSWPAADDDGEPCVRSLFVDDVLDAFDPKAAERVERRALGAAGFDDKALAPTENERARARAAAGPGAPEPAVASLRDPRVLGHLAARATWSASALEEYASCPVKWFVERLLRPSALEPDPEPMLRGVLAHRVLEAAIKALSHGGPLTPQRLDEARAAVRAALDEHADDATISPNPERRRAALRRLEADLLRYVEHTAHANSSFAPTEFELCFGGEEDERSAAELAGGELRLQGRIDRIDVNGGEAIIYDYKGKGAPPQAKWLDDARLQVGLYLLALPQLLGLDGVGGLYQPLGRDDDGRPRGLLRDGADPGLASVDRDRLAPEDFDARLDEVLQAALGAVRGIRSGALVPRPDACAWGGGCAHPSICRCEAAST